MNDTTDFLRASASGPLIERLAQPLRRLSTPGLCSPQVLMTWEDWAAELTRSAECFSELKQRARVGLLIRPTPLAYALWAALSSLECHVFLIDEGMSAEDLSGLASRHGIDVVLEVETASGRPVARLQNSTSDRRSSEQGQVTIFTSGSTGEPKPVTHTWESLVRPVRVAQTPFPQTWLLTYRPSLYAGIQVFMHCLVNRGTLVLPDTGMSTEHVIALMCRHEVRCVSATPSYWRRLITVGPRDQLQSLRLEQISLGGEASDQGLLDALKTIFPSARVVHIYATSELGRCFSVKDGRAGFPASFLEGTSDEGVELKVENGELLVRSANASQGTGGGPAPGSPAGPWLATGDLVEAVGDRFYFVSRRSELINVGGNKVQPLRVERVVLEVPGVADVLIYAKASSLVGQMVACEFVAAEGYQPADLKEAILAHCRDRLAPHERPRFIEAVPQVRLSQAGKKIRSSQQG